ERRRPGGAATRAASEETVGLTQLAQLAQPASREQDVRTIPKINSSIYNHRWYIDEARFYDEFMIVYHDARALISRLRDLLRTKVR
ncbi:MAG: hypothetical protein WAK67_14460, partial [Xanthobacteraceae bacterium]